MTTTMLTITISSAQWKRIQALNRKFPDVDVEENIPENNLSNLEIEMQLQIQVQALFIK